MAGEVQLRARAGQRTPAAAASDTEREVSKAGAITAGPTERGALPLLLTADEVAALLRTTRKAVYAMAERAALPGAVRLGRRLLVHRDDLLRWLDERRTPSPGRTRR
jgi:excisionase family DNA binding protein